MPDPGGVLGEIVARKRSDVAVRLGASDPAQAAVPTRRSLRAALAARGARFILEVKRRSPSTGSLRPEVQPAAVAAAYRHSADAISVLTDSPFFGGSLDDLRSVCQAYDGPVLAKDFIVDRRQVAEARLHGADAVLLMLAVLDDGEARAAMAEAERLNMDVLVEAKGAREVRRAIALGASIIGINNRDLRTMEVDLATTERLASLIPADRLVVSESGIGSRRDVERLAPHADAFLVGSSLMRAADTEAAARRLVYGRVKLCGVTSETDIALAARSGATFAGLIMVPGTPRCLDSARAVQLAEAGSDAKLATVGVFRDADPLEVADQARSLGLRAVQLHGREGAAYVAGVKSLLPKGCEVWSAAAVGEEVPEEVAGADRTLFDTQVDGRSGGTGRTFDWSRLQGRGDLGRALLAGGLNAGNARAASCVGAFALDVCSGVEATPGRKDPAKLGAFFQALRTPCRGDAPPC